MRAIDADALIKSIKECIEVKDAYQEWEQVQGLECALMCIEEQPIITPERKQGFWIVARNQNKEDTENGNYRFICSVCGCSDVHSKAVAVPYCWNCGAEMKE